MKRLVKGLLCILLLIGCSSKGTNDLDENKYLEDSNNEVIHDEQSNAVSNDEIANIDGDVTNNEEVSDTDNTKACESQITSDSITYNPCEEKIIFTLDSSMSEDDNIGILINFVKENILEDTSDVKYRVDLNGALLNGQSDFVVMNRSTSEEIKKVTLVVYGMYGKTNASFDEGTRTLYYTLDNTKTKEENSTDLMNYLMRYVLVNSSVTTFVYDFDEAISTGSSIMSFGRQVNGVFSELTDLAMVLVTSGTYKGYTGKVFSGTVSSSNIKEINACTLLDSSTLSCPDGVWNLVEYYGQMMIEITNREQENAFDESIRHNGYRTVTRYVIIQDTFDIAGNYFYSYTFKNDTAAHDHAWDNYDSFNNWEEMYNYFVENDISVFLREDLKAGTPLYAYEVPPMDKELVHCLYEIMPAHNLEVEKYCPAYIRKTILGRPE